MKKKIRKKNNSILFLLISCWNFLKLRRKYQLIGLAGLVIFTGILEFFTISYSIQFLRIFEDPSLKLVESSFLNKLINIFSINDENIAIFISILFLFLIIISSLSRLINIWLNSRLSALIGSDFSCEVYKRTLHQPYQFHINRNSSEIINTATNEINNSIGIIQLSLQFFSAIFLISSIIIGMFTINIRLAIMIFVIFGSCYLLIGKFVKERLTRNSRFVTQARERQVKSLQEGLGAIRDVLLDGSQETFINLYENDDRPMRKRQYENNFFAGFPKLALEAIVLILFASIGIINYFLDFNNLDILPLLGSFALASQKLLTSMQQAYSGWAGIKSNTASLEKVLGILKEQFDLKQYLVLKKPLSKIKKIEFKNISFKYDFEDKFIFRKIDLIINEGNKIGIIGPTGAGKSTFIDLFMGFLTPTSGKILVNNSNIHDLKNFKNMSSWRSSLAHVPQKIFLTDRSFSENIAFGIPFDEIDQDRVQYCAEVAKISSFIEDLPLNYKTFLGERGTRISGGQAQRIGIARAIYKNAKVLVLDEATSALDIETENEVINSLNKFNKDLTLIMIAHRYSTLKGCEFILKIENKDVINLGSPKNII